MKSILPISMHINTRKILNIAALSVMCMAFAAPADARKVRKLNEDIVTDFIEHTSDITSGQNLSMSQDDIQEFLERHIHEDARFSSLIIYNIPGQGEQMSKMALGKTEFVEQIEEGAKKLEEYYNEVEIGTIKISEDKQKAIVQTVGKESGKMNIPDGQGGFSQVPVEGESTCHQIVTISKRHVVQLYNANCETRISFIQE